jgi:hypothetical protein
MEDDDDSIPGLLPPNLDATDDDDSSDEENEQPRQIKMSILPFDPGTILLEATAPSEHSEKIKRPIIRKLHHARVVFKDQLQGDTGANCGATNEASILWHYRLLMTPIPITTYSEDKTEEASCVAIGTGIIKIVANDNTVSEWTMLHTPGSTGTILSPDRYMHDHSEISEFNHNGRKDSHGKISFRDAQNRVITEIDMRRRKDGLWFTTNPILLPNAQAPEPSKETPARPSINSARTATWTTPLSKALQHLELWHQRLGHAAPRTLKRTQQVVDGIPNLPDAYPLFCCPFCDKAKLRKNHGGKKSTKEAFVPGTAFHMDLGFIRGPKNLQDVLQDGAVPKETVLKSHDGFSSYLLIIDAATRYIWVFLLKSKDPPIAIIDQFLTKHGTARRGTITTTPDGLLDKSMSFKKVCTNQGYQLNTAEMNLDFESAGVEQLHHTIRTDNGGELAGSDEFRTKVGEHGYILETTAPDTSSQNGLAERPHRTLKEKVRCLLYTAGLGVTFWSSALLHAVWLYNRTFHTELDSTPYQMYTGRRPTVDGLLTFGCRLTPKKSTSRGPALNPNTYDGIFLGYRATMDNIIYWDTNAQRVRTAKHHEHDEMQYGSAPDERSPASKHLLETMTGAPHTERRTDILLERTDKAYDTQTDDVRPLHEQIIDDSPLPFAASAAKFARPSPIELTQQLEMMDISLNIFEPAVSETLPLQGTHDTLGLITEQHPEYEETVVFKQCHPGTVSHKTIRRWKSRLKGSIIRMIDDITITDTTQLKRIIREKRQKGQTQVKIQFAQPLWSSMTGEGLPTLHFDQLNVIAHHLHAMKTGHDLWLDKTEWPPIDDDTIALAIMKGLALPKLTRRRAMQSKSWDKFHASEWTQLNKYDKQTMFGKPCPRPLDPDVVVLPWVWTYLYKIDPVTLEDVEKSRGTCNGGTRHGKVVTLAETYAACVEQPAHRLTWALIAALNYVGLGCDVSNAFAEAPPPKEPFYMVADAQFCDWWENCLGNPPLPRGYVIPILRNLQGHPEAPRLWHKHINGILLTKMGFQHTTHKPCLYFKHHEIHGLVIVLRQVDDFIIGAKSMDLCLEIKQQIQDNMVNLLNELGVIKRFNGLDIQQTRDYIKISCPTYIDKIVEHHGWQNETTANLPLPMRNDSVYQANLELSYGPDDIKEQRELETQMGFSYRQAIGELIFAMTICRLDISPAVIKLSQYSHAPAKCHYQAAKAVFVYLHATKADGIYYWRPSARLDLPQEDLPVTVASPDKLKDYMDMDDPLRTKGASDSTWGNDRRHRRSTGGVVFLLAGGAVYYRTRLQATVAQSSTEAEFGFMTDAGKAALYIRSIMEELQLEQILPTQIAVDNRGAQRMTNAQQPTKRTRHVDMKEFVILQWTEEERITYENVPSALNPSDSLSKPTGRTKFYEHRDILMGRRRPQYVAPLKAFKIIIDSTYRNLRELLLHSNTLVYASVGE